MDGTTVLKKATFGHCHDGTFGVLEAVERGTVAMLIRCGAWLIASVRPPRPIELRHAAVLGRVRFRLAALHGAAAATLEHRLRTTPGIQAASASTLTGSVLLHHATAFSTAELMQSVSELHELLAHAPPGPAPPAISSSPLGSEAATWHDRLAGPLLDELVVSVETGLLART